MNIAMFSWEALEGLSVGGGAVYASRLAAALARAGHRVRLFTRQGPGQAMDEAVGGFLLRRCPWDRKRGFFEEIEALAGSFAHYFADAMKTDGEYDVIHCHEWFTVLAGLRALALCPARLAVSFHTTEWARTGVWPDAGDSARIAAVERMGLERADAVAAASFWIRRKIHEQYHPPDWKCEVIHHGADVPDAESVAAKAETLRQILGLEPGKPCLLFAGRFSRSAGGDLAARACRLASAHVPDARFLFVGAGPLEEHMRREAGPAAIFLPPQDRGVPPEFYHAVDLVLAPFRRDHSGRAVLPAWSAERPVATLKDTVPAEFIMPDTNGWTVRDDPAELAAVIVTAFANPDVRTWMGRNGRVALETAFTWDEAARRLVGLYQRRERLTPG